ncbi:MAG: response regulator [Oscillospiraceae bacterium]|jgi:signal transduction histidine kinase/DNA-binding response OmpR family regulator|nr:response regulator [Oscillospiraceae bacterium]
MNIYAKVHGTARRRILLALLLAVLLFACVSVPALAAGDGVSADKSAITDLKKYPIYAKRGFSSADVKRIPSDVIPVSPETVALYKNIFPGTSNRKFLSPFEEDPIEFTLFIPFRSHSSGNGHASGDRYTYPALFLAGIGENWEIYLNGTKIADEIHLNANGHITIHANYRSVGVPFEQRLLRDEDNLLVIRFIGSPSSTYTGLYYSSPYYIGDYASIGTVLSDTGTLVQCTVYVVVGLYHLLLFLMRRKDRENLLYALFSIDVGLYFITRSPLINRVIINTAVSQRLELTAVYAVPFFLAAFLEHLGQKRILLPTRIYGFFICALALVQAYFPLRFAGDAMTLWQIVAIVFMGYILIYDTLIRFLRTLRAGWRATERDEKRPTRGAVTRRELFGTQLGNIVIVMVLIVVTAVFDVFNALVLHTGTLLTRYSFFIFTIAAAVIMARNYANSYIKANAAKIVLEQSNTSLEALVEERTAELAEQVQIAESASQAKSAFMATMSHEIRTPLNAIIGLGEIELADTLPSKAHENIAKITSSGKTLLHIINDILDISKIEAGSFTLVPVEYDTAAMLSETVQLNAVRIGSKPIMFELSIADDLPARLFGDEIRVRQVLNNILSNAIKYTRVGYVRLDVACKFAGGAAVMVFKVTDSGIGIHEEDLDKLFTEYSQLDMKANRKIEGTGLGLAITKKLIDLMDGKITVRSEYGRGSEFTVRVKQGIIDETPIGRVTASKLEAFELSAADDKVFAHSRTFDARVLLVDDVSINLDVAEGLMQPYGLTIDRVTSGREAVELVASGQHKYDLILMDHMMPEMDGVEATQKIRTEVGTEYARTVPITALTANALAGNEEMFLANGFNDYLSKPIDLVKLDELLVRWLGGKAEKASVPIPADTAPAGIRSIDGVDADAGIARYRTEAVFARLLKSYAAGTPALLDKLRNPTEETLAEYIVNVHGLKGGSYGVSANTVGKLAEELELAGKDGDFAKVLAKNAALIATAEKLIGDINTVFP